MKRETNNEMDLLLRRLGRSAADSWAEGDHLDADELSSYAENALPAAARARYTEHLAECASCRKLVAQLGSSAGVVSAAQTAKVSEPSALRNFLASLFSPLVLRYAVPALGLIVVAVIGFTVLRRNEQATDVAQLTPENKATSVQPKQVETPAPGVGDSRGIASPEATEAVRGERVKESQATASPSASAQNRVAAPANEAAPVAQAEPPPASAPPEPKPVITADETQKKAATEARKEEVNNRAGSAVPAQKSATASVKGDVRRSDNDFAAPRAPAPAAGGGSVKLHRDRTGDNKDAESRSVAGHRFRREGGVWIDTDYDSSRSPISLARGSEQYRALVADEPAIKIIAEQLEGEIIVVWKGRTYRIL